MSQTETIATHDVGATAPIPSFADPVIRNPKVILKIVGDGSTVAEKDIYSLVKDKFIGCGLLYLKSVQVSYRFTASGQYLKVGFCPSGQNLPLDFTSMRENGISASANSYTYGNNVIVNLVPGDNVSRQIHPVPADKARLAIQISSSKDMAGYVIFEVIPGGEWIMDAGVFPLN